MENEIMVRRDLSAMLAVTAMMASTENWGSNNLPRHKVEETKSTERKMNKAKKKKLKQQKASKKRNR